MSPTMRASFAPRTTALVWWSISSIVTGSVFWYPRTLLPTESPTRITGMPASSRIRAVGKSYAVSIGNRRPSAFQVAKSWIVTMARASFPSLGAPGRARGVHGSGGSVRREGSDSRRELQRDPGRRGVDHEAGPAGQPDPPGDGGLEVAELLDLEDGGEARPELLRARVDLHGLLPRQIDSEGLEDDLDESFPLDVRRRALRVGRQLVDESHDVERRDVRSSLALAEPERDPVHSA